MTTFTIDTENTITAYDAREEDRLARAEGLEGAFSTEKEFTKLSASWPITRFVDTWNAFAGVVPFDGLKPVKKFTDRKTAVARIWKALQALTPTPAPQAAPAASKKSKVGTEAKASDAAPTARDGSKKAIVLDMLKRPDGATLADIMAATAWKAHSVRGFISGALGKKMGITVESTRTPEGARTYRIAE